jgi:hypothetical protein
LNNAIQPRSTPLPNAPLPKSLLTIVAQIRRILKTSSRYLESFLAFVTLINNVCTETQERNWFNQQLVLLLHCFWLPLNRDWPSAFAMLA